MFIGGFWHEPNEDAVCYFVQDILPLIRQELNDVVFNIIGSNIPRSVSRLESPSVRAIGYVADPAPHFEQCRVFVSPLRYGAGMKGKIGQSMSFGLPVVTTALGAEGLLLVDGENALIVDGPEAFARAVIRLYTDERLWTRIAANSVAHIERHFSETEARRRLERIFPVPASIGHVPAPQHDPKPAR
jgi:glycosyltransferase involved in cell wall biosynthesis